MKYRLGSCVNCEKEMEEEGVVMVCKNCFRVNNYNEKGGVKKEMATIKETALDYQPQQTLNIADLEKVSVDFEVYEKTKTDGEGKDYSYKCVELNQKEYRMPNTVFEEIQKILKIKPDVKFVKVTKTGEGLKTRYSVEVVD